MRIELVTDTDNPAFLGFFIGVGRGHVRYGPILLKNSFFHSGAQH